MDAILNYPGGKWRMASKIAAMMPPHHTYLEPYFGSGAVLFTKPPSRIETINDLDGEVVNFFRVLREQPEALSKLIALTPYARTVYEYAWDARKNTDDLERAFNFVVRSNMSFGFKTRAMSGFKTDIHGREYAYAVRKWCRLPDALMDAAARLKMVQIECRSALDLIRRYNHQDVLIYADPPYLLNVRGGYMYQHEMSNQDHVELLAALMEHKGPVILSGYHSDMYDTTLNGWRCIEQTSYIQNKQQRTEVLWCNFLPNDEPLFLD